MSGSAALPAPHDSPRAGLPPASAGKPVVTATHECWSCDIAFTRKMLAWHLRNDHKVLACKICGARVVSFLSLVSSSFLAHFCSDDCREEAKNRRLCAKCLQVWDQTIPVGIPYCHPCRRAFGHIRRQISEVSRSLKALGADDLQEDPRKRGEWKR